jgi:gamma-glutamyltranspeptidase
MTCSREKRKIIYGGRYSWRIYHYTSVLQTILNVSEFNMSMQEAVNAPRFHHGFQTITFEPDSFDKGLLAKK